MFDHYLKNLRKAGWNWLEHKNSWYYRAPRNKDRRSGRAEKRSARQEAQKELDDERKIR